MKIYRLFLGSLAHGEIFELMNRRRGFSLIEVLVSVVILCIGLLSLVKFQTSIMRSNMLAKERTKAVILAQEAIDLYRSIPLDRVDIPLVIDEYHTTTFTLTQNVNVLGNGEVKVAITVTWPDISDDGGKVTDETTVALASVVSMRDINRLSTRDTLIPTVGFTCLPSGKIVNVGGNC